MEFHFLLRPAALLRSTARSEIHGFFWCFRSIFGRETELVVIICLPLYSLLHRYPGLGAGVIYYLERAVRGPLPANCVL